MQILPRCFRQSLSVFGAAALLASVTAGAAPVLFSFTGRVAELDGDTSLLPWAIPYGAPCELLLRYDPDLLPRSDASTQYGLYYSTDPKAFAVWARAGALQAMSTAPGPTDAPFNLRVFHGWNNRYGMDSDYAGPAMRLNLPALPTNTVPGLAFYFTHATAAAFPSAALPLELPPASAFGVRRLVLYLMQTDSGGNPTGKLFAVQGEIDTITKDPAPSLLAAPTAASGLRLSWSLLHTGYALQAAGSPAATTWTPVAAPVTSAVTEHVVTVPGGDAARFFRLVKN
jgi:hypothetical protein